MYLLYISSILFILYRLYKCIDNKNYNKFDNEKEYSFIIKNIEYIKNDKIIEIINYNNRYDIQKEFKLINIFFIEFYIVNYIYNGIEYKFTCNNNFFKFPIYKKSEIENYVYINKINKASLILNDCEELDILDIILYFLGPNYNFYEDLNIKIEVEKILKYYFLKNKFIYEKIDFINKNFFIKLYDNFNNEYTITDYLKWNPNIHK